MPQVFAVYARVIFREINFLSMIEDGHLMYFSSWSKFDRYITRAEKSRQSREINYYRRINAHLCIISSHCNISIRTVSPTTKPIGPSDNIIYYIRIILHGVCALICVDEHLRRFHLRSWIINRQLRPLVSIARSHAPSCRTMMRLAIWICNIVTRIILITSF